MSLFRDEEVKAFTDETGQAELFKIFTQLPESGQGLVVQDVQQIPMPVFNLENSMVKQVETAAKAPFTLPRVSGEKRDFAS